MPVRQGALRPARERVMAMMGQLPEAARTAILNSYAPAAAGCASVTAPMPVRRPSRP
ncbi:hypothetical protein SVIOM74S_01105 [Streptomyces violarus]